jgi:hypothetical protein
MPQFGEANVAQLPYQLTAVDGVAANAEVRQFDYDAEHIEMGRFLVGKKGFGCVSCHDIAGRPNFGTRGPDLATMQHRVRFEWYMRWIDDPQRMQPGTRMPTVFPNGTSAIKSVLQGDGRLQAAAIWEYLSLGANLPLPEGLDPIRGLVVEPGTRARVMRTFMPGAGTRAIAVGFPHGVSVAFDASQCRLAYAWSGGFLDATPIWTNRGGNPATLQGSKFWETPAGFPWEATGSPGQPPEWSGRPDPALGAPLGEGEKYDGRVRLSFLDYGVSPDGTPTFHYELEPREADLAAPRLEIHETVRSLQNLAGVGVARDFRLRPNRPGVAWFLVAFSSDRPRVLDLDGRPRDLAEGVEVWEYAALRHALLLNGEPTGLQLAKVVSAPNSSRWRIERQANTWRVSLWFPMQPAAADIPLRLDIQAPYRDDPLMIRELLK